ncbi:plasmid segregation centromere-binding protein ParR [uncultured Subdoligranulum sp.]|uniref:plasmid segregation centromere-binding protein ParR n=1 Tax=uncultured Subdoligranulum sp. TaxID=512298 RepID=UPI0032081C45
MNRPQFVFRPNLRDPAQRRAWQLLQAQPAGERSAYLAACILKSDDRAAVQKELRKVLKEELGKIQVTAVPAEPKPKKAVPSATLEFFSALQQDAPE